MKVKSESEVAQLCLTLSDSVDCSPPGSSVHGIFQARVLEWGAIAFSEWLSAVSIDLGRGQGSSLVVQWLRVCSQGGGPEFDPWAVAPHSSTLAWKIPWTEEPGRLQSMGSLRVGHE